MLRRTTRRDVEKSKNRRKQEDEANILQLDKVDTQRSNLNSKYLSVTLCVKVHLTPKFFFR